MLLTHEPNEIHPSNKTSIYPKLCSIESRNYKLQPLQCFYRPFTAYLWEKRLYTAFLRNYGPLYKLSGPQTFWPLDIWVPGVFHRLLPWHMLNAPAQCSRFSWIPHSVVSTMGHSFSCHPRHTWIILHGSTYSPLLNSDLHGWKMLQTAS